jgi:hypothetical protein
MGEEQTRRRFLGAGLAATGFVPFVGRNAFSTDLSNTIEIESDGGGMAAYEFTVSGSLRQEDWDDHVNGNRAYGHVGPKRGTDTFSYSGDVTGFCLAGPATAYRNGYRVNQEGYPAPNGVLTPGDFPSHSGTSRLKIESDGGGIAAYEFEVNGSVSQVDWDDQVNGNRAYGHVGPKRGADEFDVTGDVTRFALAGPATVYLDGAEVKPSSGVERSVVRASPQGEISVRPDTLVLFEAVARGYHGSYATGRWYVDKQQWIGPTIFHGGLGGRGRTTFTYSFDEEGTHHVRADLYDEGATPEDSDPIGSAVWKVHVSSSGNQAPTVELVEPGPNAVLQDSDDPRTFEVTARDPEGALDRIVWWQSQCDAVVTVDHASGASATESLSFASDYGCPLGVRAIDEDGAISDLNGWKVEKSD